MIHDTTRIVRFTGLLSAALSTGVFFGTRISLGPSSKSFAPTTYVEVQQATIRNLRPVMAPLLPGSVAANLAVLGLSVRERRSPGFALTLLGVISQLASVILIGRFELPINARVMTWSPENLPEGWEGKGALGDRPHRQDRNLGRRARMLGGCGADISGALRRQRPGLSGSDSGRLNSSLGVTYRHILTIAKSSPYTP